MPRTRWRGLLLVPCLATALLGFGAVAAEDQDLGTQRQRLEAVKERAEALEQRLLERHQRLQGLDAELAELERSVAAAERAVRETEQALAEQRQRLERLRERRDRRADALTEERGVLAEQVRAAWQTGNDSFLRLLLSQDQPDRLDRLTVYYRHFAEARAARIERAMAALERVRELSAQIAREVERLEALQQRRDQRRARLADRLAAREDVAERLRREVREGDQRLMRLRTDAERLRELIVELRAERRRSRQAPSTPNDDAGEANWPVTGELLAGYGSQRTGGLRWSGVLIGAQAGDAVRAVAAGEVVFADWLRGVGLLIIIDHGHGRLSLYGHNRALYREAGDRVDGGEVIAAVGSSGGQRREGLYFEVRIDGEPVDPLAWLERR